MTRLLIAAMFLLAAAAIAQTPAPAPAHTPAPATPNDSMEPGVNTSSATQQSTAGAAPAPAPRAAPAATPSKADQAKAKGNAKDRLDLDASQITGNRELPKVLYIVPWRSAELGDLVGRPVNSLLDEVLEPVDRDVFRRQNRYFDALQPNQAAPAGKSEK